MRAARKTAKLWSWWIVTTVIVMTFGASHTNAQLMRYSDHEAQDIVGDGDGTAEPGETLQIQIALWNSAGSTATGMSGTLSTTTPFAYVIDGTATWPDIPRSETHWSDSPHFTVRLDPSFHCGDWVWFELDVSSDVRSWSFEFAVIVGREAALFADDMEAGDGDWTWEGSPAWERRTVGCDDGYCRFVPNLATTSESSLIMPEITALPADAVLRFRHSMLSDSGRDGGILEYSTDEGGSWSDADPLITQGDYNDFVSVFGDDGWTGDLWCPGWRTVNVDLSSLAASDVMFRWRFASGSSGGGDGWYIDDVEIKIVTPVVSYDMESGTSGWTRQEPIGSNPWRLVTYRSVSPSHSWFAEDVADDTESILIMPTVNDIPDHTVLRFEHYMESSPISDGGVLEFTTDGVDWSLGEAGRWFTQGGYNGEIDSANPAGLGDAWTGDSLCWQTVEFNLSHVVGEDVTFRWRYGNMGDYQEVGWFVDDIAVELRPYTCDIHPCASHADCDDLVACTIDTCDTGSGLCLHTPNDSVCDDGVTCTTDVCDSLAGCQSTADDLLCDDDLFCNGAETCDAVLDCQTGTSPCDDGVSCTVDTCDEANDSCTNTPDAGSCGDGQFCNGAEICDLALDCQAGTPVDCGDGIPCSIDTCDEGSDTCIHTPDDPACDDGAACTTDTCELGLGCTYVADHAQCDDGVDCSVDVCEFGTGCTFTPDHAQCDDAVGCTLDTCELSLGLCVSVADDTQCDDADPFTVDVCDETTGCVFIPLDSDGDGAPDWSDNCPDEPQVDQADWDHDGSGDACDPCPRDPADSCSPLATLDLPRDVPADEIRLGDLFGDVPSYDLQSLVFGRADGHVAVLVVEDFEFHSLHSSNGGVSFSSEVTVAGGSGQPPVRPPLVATMSRVGDLYVLYWVVHPSGGFGLRFVGSTDMGQSWSSSVEVRRSERIENLKITANDGGVLAVLIYDLPSTLISYDDGASWSSGVGLVRSHQLREPRPTQGIDLAVGDDDKVYVVFTEEDLHWEDTRICLNTIEPSGQIIPLHLDEKLGFDPFLDIWDSSYPDVEIAHGGSVLLSFYLFHEYTPDPGQPFGSSVVVMRSPDGSFGVPEYRIKTNENDVYLPNLITRPTDELVMLRLVTPSSTYYAMPLDFTSGFGTKRYIGTGHYVGIVPTPAGNWGTVQHETSGSIYVRVSMNDGGSWGSSSRVDSDDGESVLGSLTATNSDDLVVTYLDDKLDPGRDMNVYLNRSPVNPVSFTNEQRVDSDLRYRNVPFLTTLSLATDGTNSVYAAMAPVAVGPHSDIYLAVSGNGGYSFTAPQRVSAGVAGQQRCDAPSVAATPDGGVYVVYRADGQLRFNASTDFGASWPGTDILLGDVAGASVPAWGLPGPVETAELDIEALSGGTVHVAWSDATDARVATSVNYGGSFGTKTFASGVSESYRSPSLCVDGDRVFLAFLSRDDQDRPTSILAAISQNAGATWTTPTELRSGGSGTAVEPPHVACNGDRAVVVWPDARSGPYRVHAARFDGAAWQVERELSGPADRDNLLPTALYSSTMDVVVMFQGSPGVYVGASRDGGASFEAARRLDDAELNRDADSVAPQLTADGLGNAWASWIEFSAGLASIAVRHSSDGGRSWDPVRRLDRQAPQGAFWNQHGVSEDYSAALPGAALFVWNGERRSFLYDGLVNAYDLDDLDRDDVDNVVDNCPENPNLDQTDSDTDGAGDVCDCAPGDDSLWSAPGAVRNLELDHDPLSGSTTLAWLAPSAPGAAQAATRYDTIRTQDASDFTTGAVCVETDGTDTTSIDGATPAAGVVYFYLPRAKNDCGLGSSGADSGDLARAMRECP
jgi:hypothetical protein